MSRGELEMAVRWSDQKGMHLVSDEIYALSHVEHPTAAASESLLTNQRAAEAVMEGGGIDEDEKKEEEEEAVKFVSLGEVVKDMGLGGLGPLRHVVWGLSKDFGMSGVRFGVVWTQNEALQGALDTAANFTCVAGPVQAFAASLFSNQPFIDRYLSENSRRLGQSCGILMAGLEALGLTYYRPAYGMFLWADLSPLLQKVKAPQQPPDRASSSSSEANQEHGNFSEERIIYERLWKEAGLVVTPGESQHMDAPGWFRFCYAYVSQSTLKVAVGKLTEFVQSLE